MLTNPHNLPTRSQLKQDLFVLDHCQYKQNGYFIEIGAADGITFSNTWLLEKNFNWNGIVVDPCRRWHAELTKNRTCHIDHRCVWQISGQKLTFHETSDALLSTINGFENNDLHNTSRDSTIPFYETESVSLNDLLQEYTAPLRIDYLSIDTEGSELSILQGIDFSRYRFDVITCEHNHVEDRRYKIHNLLTAHNYKRVLTEISDFDDWYVLKEVPPDLLPT